MAIELVVNGKEETVTSSPDTPLLYVLRDELGLKGPKFGCGLEQCGACSVLANGASRRSCLKPLSDFDGQTITTAEGLPALWAQTKNIPHVEPHPVQQAWIEHQVPQCGYCQNGMMIYHLAHRARRARPGKPDRTGTDGGRRARRRVRPGHADHG